MCQCHLRCFKVAPISFLNGFCPRLSEIVSWTFWILSWTVRWGWVGRKFPARNQYCIIYFDMRHFIRSHERNRRHSLKTADEQRRSSLTNSNDSHLFRKSSLPARAFANNSTTSNVNGAGRRFRRFNTISDDINPVTLSLVVCSIAFFIVAALFYSLYWRKWTAEPFLTIVLRPWWNCLGTSFARFEFFA